MKIERINHSGIPLITPDDILRLGQRDFAPHQGMRRAVDAGHGHKLDGAMVAAAVRVLETRHGVIFSPCDIRLTANFSGDIHSPVGPILAVESVTLNGVRCKWSQIRRTLRLQDTQQKGGAVEVNLMAGFGRGQIPHLARLALASVCAHWLMTGDKESGDAARMADQYLAPYRSYGVVPGGVPWQL